ncbi:hypothetical protein [Streptomyces osmaniensis]|uniref:Uncharacterized protein n=1 Tax=Streptomyces osmaniensis TaxID=593134 RepID=A0ABP6XPV9_9ACTN|nr:hypothetical protein KJK32_23545 [Streptomyces sp. JCM17656]
MIENLPWEEVAGNPEKYIQLLEERDAHLQRDTYQVRMELRLVRQIKKHMDTAREWRESGIPEQRQPDPAYDQPTTSTSANGKLPPRKDRILLLMSQDPQRQWKALEMADALNESSKGKSVRVAMDELYKAGKISKLPNAFYQYA